MKRILLLLYWFVSIQQLFSQVTFSDTIYQFRRENDILYGTAINYAGNEEQMFLDLYKPIGDNNLNRPLLVLVHGGAWIAGSRNEQEIQLLAKWYAKFGYVVASVSYRLGFHPSTGNGSNTATCPLVTAESNCVYPADSAEMVRALYRAMQDVKGAIRYLKGRAVEDSVCVSNVFLAGVSAGGFNALAAAMLDVDSEKPNLAGSLSPAPGPATTLGYCHNYFNLQGSNISLSRPDLGSIDGEIALNGFNSRVKGIANYYGGMMENLLELSNGPLPALYLFHQTNDVVVACNYTRLLGEFSFGCLAPLGFLGCQQIWNTPRAYGSCGIQALIVNNNYPIQFTADIVQNGGPNCLADPPGHSLLSIYQRAKNAATFFAPLIAEDSSCLTTGVNNVQRSFSIQPNPTTNWFSVLSSDAPASLHVFNLEGRMVFAASQEALEANTFQVDHLLAGVYYITLQQKNGAKFTQKLLKISP
jgi:dienelactone hydrolase